MWLGRWIRPSRAKQRVSVVLVRFIIFHERSFIRPQRVQHHHIVSTQVPHSRQFHPSDSFLTCFFSACAGAGRALSLRPTPLGPADTVNTGRSPPQASQTRCVCRLMQVHIRHAQLPGLGAGGFVIGFLVRTSSSSSSSSVRSMNGVSFLIDAPSGGFAESDGLEGIWTSSST
jgi:hypothetical protein